MSQFWNKVQMVPCGGCWIWTGGTRKGYGRFCGSGKMRSAHRLAYESEVGPIPDGLQLDHLCRNRACVNPVHLEPVTVRQNVQRGLCGDLKEQAPACLHGHEYTEENTYISPSGHRCCRECRRRNSAELRARVKKSGAKAGQ